MSNRSQATRVAGHSTVRLSPSPGVEVCEDLGRRNACVSQLSQLSTEQRVWCLNIDQVALGYVGLLNIEPVRDVDLKKKWVIFYYRSVETHVLSYRHARTHTNRGYPLCLCTLRSRRELEKGLPTLYYKTPDIKFLLSDYCFSIPLVPSPFLSLDLTSGPFTRTLRSENLFTPGPLFLNTRERGSDDSHIEGSIKGHPYLMES